MEWHVVSLQEPFWARAIRCETKLHCMERVGRILLVVVAVAKSEPSGEKYPSRHFAVQTGRWILPRQSHFAHRVWGRRTHSMVYALAAAQNKKIEMRQTTGMGGRDFGGVEDLSRQSLA